MYISWMEPLIPNGVISYYTIYCLEKNASITIQPLSSTLDTFYEVVPGFYLNDTVGGLTPFTEYGCFVSANTSRGEGNFSYVVFQTTDEYGKHSLTNSPVSPLATKYSWF